LLHIELVQTQDIRQNCKLLPQINRKYREQPSKLIPPDKDTSTMPRICPSLSRTRSRYFHWVFIFINTCTGPAQLATISLSKPTSIFALTVIKLRAIYLTNQSQSNIYIISESHSPTTMNSDAISTCTRQQSIQ
jgi:hypothetical protein